MRNSSLFTESLSTYTFVGLNIDVSICLTNLVDHCVGNRSATVQQISWQNGRKQFCEYGSKFQKPSESEKELANLEYPGTNQLQICLHLGREGGGWSTFGQFPNNKLHV